MYWHWTSVPQRNPLIFVLEYPDQGLGFLINMCHLNVLDLCSPGESFDSCGGVSRSRVGILDRRSRGI